MFKKIIFPFLLGTTVLFAETAEVEKKDNSHLSNSTTSNTEKKEDKRDRKRNKNARQNQARRSEGDVELTRNIRAEITNDKSLSMEAKNITITTLNGVVSLIGSVKSSDEKMKVENHARNFANNKNVRNELKVELTSEEKAR